ncbi:AAA family ATPase [Streptomyces sp. A012304]|uniref:helix-turn-helix transcriptional regulator n=1 Tax=Streptomyces sp. A012304 TaxID=375446 RepID=UPI0022315B54|nr:AAA family ATPase [Streptomyces sp. A012304]GKQ35361.1 hypothetical protein ALMP_19050 [Streptomyces sp. A012304]
MTTDLAARPGGSTETAAPPAQPELVGRDAEIRRLWDAVTTPSGPAVVLLRGEAGAGRTTVLDALGRRLRAAGTPSHHLTCLPGARLTPGLLAHRLTAALTEPASGCPGAGHPPEPRRAGEAPDPAGGPGDSGPAGRPPALDQALRVHGPAVLLIDDAQHADAESVSLLRSLLPTLPSVRLVLGLSAAGSSRQAGRRAAAAPTPWCEDGTGIVVDLPPLARGDVARLLTARLRAVPDERLLDEVHRLGAGNPAAVLAVVGAAGSTMVKVLIGRAHLVEGRMPAVPPDDDRFTPALRELGDTAWRVAKALSLLERAPIRTARLVASATGLSPAAVDEALGRLAASGLVTGPEDRTRPGSGCAAAARPSGWAFRVPLVALAVRARVGPYERRAVSAVAVRARWAADDAGEDLGARTAESDAWLADRLVDAGGLVDRQRAARELAAAVTRLRDTHRGQAARWLTAAVELADEPALYTSTVIEYAVNAMREQDLQALDETIWAVVRARSGQLDPQTRQSLLAMEMTQLAAQGDLAELAARYRALVADVRRVPLLPAVVATCLLGRWSDLPGLIDATGADRHPEPGVRYFPRMAKAAARLVAGDPADLYRMLDLPPGERPSHTPALEAVVPLCERLLIGQDARTVTAQLARHGATSDRLPAPAAVLHRFLTGAWSRALAAAGSLMATTPPTVSGPVGVLVHARASTTLLAQGWPSRAGTVLDIADVPGLPMAYLLAAERAAVHLFFGRTDAARDSLRRGLAEAAERGAVVGTAALWSGLTLVEAERGRADLVASGLDELRRIASTGGDGDRLTYLRTRVEARAGHAGAASEAIALARSLGQPFELARTLLAVARAERFLEPGGHGVPAGQLLGEAYELFGGLGALLWRHRTRTALRDAGLPVPRRPAVAEENDVLLTRLVSEGLSNRRIATVLSVSETSVSTRLNRLYQRLGVRSRVELATAVVTGTRGLDPLPEPEFSSPAGSGQNPPCRSRT